MHINFISHSNLVESNVLQKFLISLRERGISFDHDIIFLAELDGVFIDIQWMRLNLVHNWLHL